LLLDIGAHQVVQRRLVNQTRPALQAKAAGDTHHGGHGLRMLGKVDFLAERQLRVEVLQRDGGAGICFHQCPLDGAQLVSAAQVDLNGGDKPIEQPRGIGSAVELCSGE
jgi:hypothetical protein